MNNVFWLWGVTKELLVALGVPRVRSGWRADNGEKPVTGLQVETPFHEPGSLLACKGGTTGRWNQQPAITPGNVPAETVRLVLWSKRLDNPALNKRGDFYLPRKIDTPILQGSQIYLPARVTCLERITYGFCFQRIRIYVTLFYFDSAPLGNYVDNAQTRNKFGRLYMQIPLKNIHPGRPRHKVFCSTFIGAATLNTIAITAHINPHFIPRNVFVWRRIAVFQHIQVHSFFHVCDKRLYFGCTWFHYCGKAIAASIAIIMTTTNNSISVKPRRVLFCFISSPLFLLCPIRLSSPKNLSRKVVMRDLIGDFAFHHNRFPIKTFGNDSVTTTTDSRVLRTAISAMTTFN